MISSACCSPACQMLPFFSSAPRHLPSSIRCCGRFCGAPFLQPQSHQQQQQHQQRRRRYWTITTAMASSSPSAAGENHHTVGDWYSVPDLSLRDHRFSVPLDHSSSDSSKITVFAREVVQGIIKKFNFLLRRLILISCSIHLRCSWKGRANSAAVFAVPARRAGLREPAAGGGQRMAQEGVRGLPCDFAGSSKIVEMYYLLICCHLNFCIFEFVRVFVIWQRGTGLSTPLTASSLAQVTPAEKLVEFLKHFRADSIVKDAEFIRKRIVPDARPWTVLGQVSYFFYDHNLRLESCHWIQY